MKGQYDPGMSKASHLTKPEYWFIHALLSKTIKCQEKSTRVLKMRDVYFLYNKI